MPLGPEQGKPRSSQDQPQSSLTNVSHPDTERELRLFRTLLDQSNDAIEVIDTETMRFLDVNEKASSELGYTREELLSMTVFDIDPTTSQDSVAKVRETLRQSGFVILETVHRRKDGTTFPVEVNIKRVQLDREYTVAVARNITERKIRDNRLQEYERVVEGLDEMITVVDREHRYVLANRAFLRYRGLARDEVVGRRVIDLLGEEPYEKTIKAKLDECFQGKIVSYEMKYYYPQFGERHLTITYLPIEGATGIDRIAAVLRDVTEHRQGAAMLEESEQRLRTIHERAPVGIALVDSWNRKFLQVNPKFCEIAGRSEQEMLRLKFEDITHPDDLAAGAEALRQLTEDGIAAYETEKRYLRPDGTTVWTDISVVPMSTAGEPRRWNIVIAQDITEKRQVQETLRQSEERLRLAQEAACIGTFERNFETGEVLCTARMAALFGITLAEYPKTIEEFLDMVHPDDRQHVAQLVSKSNQASTVEGEWRVVWPNGEVHWIYGKWQAFQDASGRPQRLIGVDMDITARKNLEEELRSAKEKLTEEKLYLEQEIDTELGFEEIIGQSSAWKAVLDGVSKVATSDATVLLLGETGTGKELVARAIHRLSQRKENAFIKMNCAAIPFGLLESELFGNEKGAFTGAVSKKLGRLELADKGTLFLDEIGEIPLALQPKLLRVLQDQEFERLGGTQTLKVNFRLIAATNRDLGEAVREHEFRSDLFYRLNVFPVFLPPLRERREDIPLLVEHFVGKIARRMNKTITSIPKRTMEALVGWNWPGNVRELENFIERSLILTNGSVLASPLSELHPTTGKKIVEDETLKTKEREHILRALKESRGMISGPRGAATRLGLKRTTLQSKLKILGIDPKTPSMRQN